MTPGSKTGAFQHSSLRRSSFDDTAASEFVCSSQTIDKDARPLTIRYKADSPDSFSRTDELSSHVEDAHSAYFKLSAIPFGIIASDRFAVLDVERSLALKHYVVGYPIPSLQRSEVAVVRRHLKTPNGTLELVSGCGSRCDRAEQQRQSKKTGEA